MIQRFHQYLGQPTSIAPLVTFRIAMGLLIFIGTLRFTYFGWIEDHYLEPIFHFRYFGFAWIPIFTDQVIYLIHIIMLISAMLVMIGLWYRMAIIALFLTFTYTELIDLTYYLNHYYFISLVLFIMIFAPAHRHLSFDASFFRESIAGTIPRFWIFILQLLLAVVYVCAGLAKINTEWLIDALPLRIWLPAAGSIPIVGPLFSWHLAPWLFAWTGMFYDCLIVFFLIKHDTRPWAYLSVIIFHILTGILFQIGIFPLVMIAATLIFFSADFHQKLQSHLFGKTVNLQKFSKRLTVFHKVAFYLFFGFQLLFPLRFLLYPGDLYWTEQGYRFSWRVMLMEKAGTATFYVKDSRTGREGVVDNRDFLNPHQEKQMAFQPDMILQYAHFLSDYYESQGMQTPEVRAEVYVTLNARPSTLLIDPYTDLTKLQDTWQQKTWLLPGPR